MSGPILVINPNSDARVTAGLDAALAPFRLAGGPEIACLTLAEGPVAIESAADVAAVVPRLVRLVAERRDAEAFVIACYSDPGVEACREATAAPVFGIQECGVAAALCRAERFGVIALSEASIRRHRRHLRALGLLARCVGERAASVGVAESGEAFDALHAAGRGLVADGAEAVVLGCAGMARQRAAVERALGVAVIEPTQAAVATALGAALARR
jgi:Asp/Glu/hydantoin racemase